MASRNRTLVHAARAGDPVAWDALYQRHARSLLAWLGSLPHTDTALDAEDVAAEAWMTAATKIGSYTGDDDGFGGWLFTVARNHTMNTNRRAARRATDPTGRDADVAAQRTGEHEDPSTVVVSAAHTRALLAHLTEQEAAVVAARDVVGLSVAETADLLEISKVSVRVTHHRGLGKLRRLLATETTAAAEDCETALPRSTATAT